MWRCGDVKEKRWEKINEGGNKTEGVGGTDDERGCELMIFCVERNMWNPP
jgi:hypothetical protein